MVLNKAQRDALQNAVDEGTRVFGAFNRPQLGPTERFFMARQALRAIINTVAAVCASVDANPENKP